MKFIGIALALFCMVAYAAAQLESQFLEESYDSPRHRREADPQGSISVHGTKPMSGPDRRPSLDVNYNQRVYDRNGMTADAFGGVNVRPGQSAQPHLGIQAERNYRNGFIGGFGQVQRGPGGRPDPSFGIRGGFRF